jgi:copper resistance protein C
MRNICTALCVLAAFTSAAQAHAFLVHASPGAGAVLTAPPKAVVLDFSEELEPAFSSVAVTDDRNRNVSASRILSNGREMALPLPALGPGDYTVTWRALSVDTHRTEGRFRFTVKAR